MPIIHLIAGARPNFVKIAPLYHALKDCSWCEVKLIHTGQHYSSELSDDVWNVLKLPPPDFHLGVGSGSHAEQTARTMMEYEKVCLKSSSVLTVVPGDVNSTLACALTAKKMGFRVAHLEAGLRSFDMTMPEEVNRRLTDHISDILWTPSQDADDNLKREGIPLERIFCVGNIMIDTLENLKPEIDRATIPTAFGRFGLVTLHRPSNVDSRDKLTPIIDVLTTLSSKIPLVFPLHPRTRNSLEKFGMLKELQGRDSIILLPSLDYITFIATLKKAAFVLTDSGGIQEESSHLGIPCFTLRSNTERPITVNLGTNQLVDIKTVLSTVERSLGNSKTPRAIPLWDGKTAERIGEQLRDVIGPSR